MSETENRQERSVIYSDKEVTDRIVQFLLLALKIYQEQLKKLH